MPPENQAPHHPLLQPASGVHDGGKMIECSPELAAMFGYASPDAVIGRNPADFIAPEHRDEALKRIMGGTVDPYRSVGVRRDGSRFPIEIVASAVRHGESKARMILVRDLSPVALIVDDEPVLRKMIGAMVQPIGYLPILAASGVEALAVFGDVRPALIITNFSMPDMSGGELLRHVREVDPHVPAIMVSGFAGAEIKVDENTRFLKKPFGVADLQEAIAQLPERARRGLIR